jgi:L-aspartate oxidase
MIGGVTVDLAGRTTVSGLWAAGEATSSGLHGANRLASNSLLEGLVYGAHAGHGASQAALAMPSDFRVFPITSEPLADSLESHEPLDVTDIRNSLQALMWRACGVRRSDELLREALTTIDQWRRYVLMRQFNDVEGWELQNLLIIARVMVEAALARKESRGVHLRTDYPSLDDNNWNRHIWFRNEAGSQTMGVT